MGDVTIDYALLMICRTLRTWDVLTTRDLVHEIDPMIADDLHLESALTRGQIFGLFVGSPDGWRLGDAESSNPRHTLRDIAPTRPGLYREGASEYAVLPKGAELCLRALFARRPEVTADEIHDHLVSAGWVEIPLAELLLYLARFNDFAYEDGRWWLSDSEIGPPVLSEVENLHNDMTQRMQDAQTREARLQAARLAESAAK